MSTMSMKKTQTVKTQTCGDCLHYAACQAWNIGNLANALSTTCANFEGDNVVRLPPEMTLTGDDRQFIVEVMKLRQRGYHLRIADH